MAPQMSMTIGSRENRPDFSKLLELFRRDFQVPRIGHDFQTPPIPRNFQAC